MAGTYLWTFIIITAETDRGEDEARHGLLGSPGSPLLYSLPGPSITLSNPNPIRLPSPFFLSCPGSGTWAPMAGWPLVLRGPPG